MAEPAVNMMPDEMLAEDVGKYYWDPLGFVMWAYDWDRDPMLRVVPLVEPYRSRYQSEHGPEAWACKFLEDLGQQVKARNFNGQSAVLPIREAVASGHGIAKSATVAMITNWIMSTRPHSKGTITAGSYKQLQTKTCPELQKWTKRCITGHWFQVGSDGLWIKHVDFPDSWRCDAISCAKENADSFQGQHSVNSTSFYIFDEASAISREIWEAASGGLTDGEPMWFVFGNPTQNSGPFRDCFKAHKNLWNCRQIDSRECSITNKAYLDSLVEQYGEDSDYIKVRVRGMFPAMSVNQFISTTDVDSAFGKVLLPEQFMFAPKILTLDNAWEGDDDGVIGLRQGLNFRILKVFGKNDNDIHVANLLARFEDEENTDAVFVDAGYGTGVVSAGHTLGRAWRLVWFSGESSDEGCLNKRAEMARLCRDWLKSGGAIPKDQSLYDELVEFQTVPRVDGKIQIEPKKEFKKRVGWSPGRADCLWLSFAYPVMPKASSWEEMVVNQRQESEAGFRYWSDRR